MKASAWLEINREIQYDFIREEKFVYISISIFKQTSDSWENNQIFWNETMIIQLHKIQQKTGTELLGFGFSSNWQQSPP